MSVGREDYLKKIYNLTNLPFENRRNRYDTRFWVNREKELEEWQSSIDKVVNGNLNRLEFIIGDYGNGKTMSLFKIRDELEKRNDVFSVYMTLLSESKYRGGTDFILKLFSSVDFEKLLSSASKSTLRKGIETIPKDVRFNNPRTVFSAILNEDNLSLQKDLDGKVSTRPNSIPQLALKFLGGTNFSAMELKKRLGIDEKISTFEIAELYLATWLLVMRGLGYKAVIILVDEFEYLFSLASKGVRQKYLALFRSLYDLSDDIKIEQKGMSSMLFFFASSLDGWREFESLDIRARVESQGPYSALKRRIAKKTILEPLNKDGSQALIERRLSFNRARDEIESEPLIPFTEDFVEFVHKESSGTPSVIIDICDLVMEAGLVERISKLDSKFADKILIEKGFISSPE